MTPCRRSLRITKSLLPLASVNGIATNAPLANHQMLLLPADAVKPQDVPRTPPPQTPAEKTDAAY